MARSAGRWYRKDHLLKRGRVDDQGQSSDPSPRRGRQRVASGEEASETRRNPRYRRHATWPSNTGSITTGAGRGHIAPRIPSWGLPP
jgi:hypothetical protein